MTINLNPPTILSMTTLRELPGPRRLPLLGNALQLETQKLHLILEGWVKTYGPIYQINLGGKPGVVIADPELNNQILRARPDTYRRMGAIEPVFKEMGSYGVFAAEGDDWKEQRRLVMHSLSAKHLRNFFPTMTGVIERLQGRWQRAAQLGTAVDLQKELMRLTVDVTTNLAFGYDMNTLEHEEEQLQSHLERVFPMMAQRLNSPFPYWRYFKLPADRALDRSLAAIHQTIHTFIAEARRRMAENPTLKQQPTNFLEAMLAAEGTTVDGEPIPHFSDETITGNVFTMLSAGEDTTANTLSWVCYYMMLYPEVQRRMQAEADAVLGANMLLTDLQIADNLRYSEAVTHEAMRLRPVTPIMALETNEEVVVAGVQLPKGVQLFLLTRPGVLDEQNFAQAPEFHPERWLTASDSGCPFHGAHNRTVHIPFGNGPRLCPGRSLAFLEIKATLAMICRNFELTSADSLAQVGERFAFTMLPTGLAVRFTPRVR